MGRPPSTAQSATEPVLEAEAVPQKVKRLFRRKTNPRFGVVKRQPNTLKDAVRCR
jgi:hypothetical protein